MMAKKIAKTARSQLGGRHLLFGEYLRSWTNLACGAAGPRIAYSVDIVRARNKV